MTEAIDLTGIIPQDQAVIEIKHAGTKKGTGWMITLAGPGHPKTQEWANENARKALRRQAQIEAAQANGKRYEPEERDPSDSRRENVEWVVSRIIDWTPIKIGGETFEFSDKAAAELLSRPEMGWAFAQIVEALADVRSFTQGFANGS